MDSRRIPCRLRGTRLSSPRLEKRSQALQACNLTRNIQADGVPMVHRAPGASNLQGSFFVTIGHRSHALKTHRNSSPRRLLRATIRLSSATIAFSSVERAIVVAHAPIGDSPEGGP